MRFSTLSLVRGPRLIATALLTLAFTAAAAAQTTAIGLSAVRAQRFGNENLLGFYTPQGGDFFALALASGDFNHDGADDLATGMPYDNGIAGSEVRDSGTVIVRYGVAGSGLDTRLASTVLRQGSRPDPAEVEDLYGHALAACDFNGDAFDDLAVGIPREDHLGHPDAGGVQIHYGTSAGLPALGDAFYTESTPGIPGDVEDGDRFGYSLACGDFDFDGFDDLVVGVRDEAWGSVFTYNVSYGAVIVIPGSAAGLVPASARSLDQDSAGINGGAESNDFFGLALAAGDFNRDGFDDLAIGVPGEGTFTGALQVVFGSPSGLTAEGNLLWSETDIGGVSEANECFAAHLVAGDFDQDGFDDLAVSAGVPPDFLVFSTAENPQVGQVDVLYGAADGFDRSRTQVWDQDAILGAGTNETRDDFGFAMAADDFDQDGIADLAIGHWGEAISGPEDGAVTVLMGSTAGLTAARHRAIAAGIEGFPGDAAAHGKRFGYTLSSGDFDGDGHADLAVGSPWEDQGGIADVGAETVLYGALFADGVETGTTSLWSQNASSVYFNKIRATSVAKLGPPSSKVGLQVDLFAPSVQRPATPAYVRAGPEAGLRDERTLKGTFFVDPRALTMSPNPGVNVFSMLTFADGVGPGTRTRLTFDLNRNDSVGGWAILASSFNESTNSLQFVGGAGFAVLNEPANVSHRIDFEWRAGNPGHLTVWHTKVVGGSADATGRVQLFAVDLPATQNAFVNDVFAGMVSGQDAGTYGSLYLDELSFRR